jgi:5-methylcytosine-specific restriction endonuclease McrA
MSNPPVSQLVSELFGLKKQIDSQLQSMRNRADRIDGKYEPRAEFNRWRDSKEGKLWKQKKYNEQNGCCAICKRSIKLKGAHIDHIKPISRYPNLALETKNMQIACADCNTSKNQTV